jgi:hypothetical protein
MGWQAFSWTELQERAPHVPERLAPAIEWTTDRTFEAATFMAVFLTPFALMEAALGIWRFCSDIGWAGAFFVDRGILSHWQVWFALAAFTQATSVYLNRLIAKHSESIERQK